MALQKIFSLKGCDDILMATKLCIGYRAVTGKMISNKLWKNLLKAVDLSMFCITLAAVFPYVLSFPRVIMRIPPLRDSFGRV